MDYLAQPDIADVAQQEHGPDDLAKLYKREIQLVLAAVGAEPAQDRRRRDLAGLDGNRHPQHRRQMQLNQPRSEEHTSELQSPCNLVCRLLLEKKKYTHHSNILHPQIIHVSRLRLFNYPSP